MTDLGLDPKMIKEVLETMVGWLKRGDHSA
jgi:hypothetical protein